METNLEDIKHIRSMMERSTKFLSLSGMSGVSAGIIALLGAFAAHFIIRRELSFTGTILYDLIVAASIVFIGASLTGFYFCARKAKQSGSRLWLPVTWQILYDFLIPMIVGGLFCFILILKHVSFLVAPCMLIFYGLALINAGSRTYRDIKMLGACEIILGLVAAMMPRYGLLYWGIGFGVLHIIYGIVMHYRYDMKSKKNG